MVHSGWSCGFSQCCHFSLGGIKELDAIWITLTLKLEIPIHSLLYTISSNHYFCALL